MNPNDQQPQQPEQPQPQPAFQMAPPQLTQAPTPDTNSFQQQPKVQYVVMQKSLEGLGGWLALLLVIFVLSAIGYISSTFRIPAGLHTATDPLLAIGYITAVVMIALRKKTALWVAYATIILSFLVSVINTLITANSSKVGDLISTIIISLVFHGLLALYFYVSKRVKATLVR